jgi:DNA-binding transcriptional LysR family regulator
MFEVLFAESGLSLERLRAFVEVGAASRIAAATGDDPVRQSQYSRQIKELEEFFHVKLIERQGRQTRLTGDGRELARISRFFLLGLSNFRRGCLKEEQSVRIGGSPTFVEHFVLPRLATDRRKIRYTIEMLATPEIEPRLHDLTLDFAVVTRSTPSRPLQATAIGEAQLVLWVPKTLVADKTGISRAFKASRLPLAAAVAELADATGEVLQGQQPFLTCVSFLQARAALYHKAVAAILPDFLNVSDASSFFHLPLIGCTVSYYLAWNPRLLRLNALAMRRRDALLESLTKAMKRPG